VIRRGLFAAVIAVVIPPIATAVPSPQWVGHGPTAVAILRPSGPGHAVVIYLHGWGEIEPGKASPWLRHLQRRGNIVLYPRYQLGRGDTAASTLPHLRDALKSVFADRRLRDLPVVAVGYSWGGKLVFDYAVDAAAWGVPVPAAVMSVFPASLGYGGPPRGRVPATTRVLLVEGDRDAAAAGPKYRRWLLRHARGPTTYRFLRSTPGFAMTHDAASRTSEPARRAFWLPLDAIVAAVRRG
jgi:dienelactone hydrolase